MRLLPPVVTGIGRYLRHLLLQLNQISPPDLAFQALCLPDQTLPANIPRLVMTGPSAYAKPLGLLQQIWVPPVVRRSGCDLYHYTYYDPPWSAGRPFVATCYDIEPLRHPELFSRKIVLYYRLFTLRLRAARRVIVISEQTKRDLVELRGLAPERVQVAYLAAEEEFRPIDDRQQLTAIRKHYSLPERYVLYVGNTRAHKNVGRIIEALALMQQRYADLGLAIVGAPDVGRPAVEHTIQRLGLQQTVRFLNRIPEQDLPLLYNGAQAFVFPSLYEGFGLPVLEAMACGTPVVTSDRASLPEIVGDAGIIVDPLDSSAIAAAILRLIEDRPAARQLAQAGIQRAQRFSWRRCAEAHLKVYREALQ